MDTYTNGHEININKCVNIQKLINLTQPKVTPHYLNNIIIRT